MAEINSKGERLISVVRVIEYHGTDSWISKVMAASRVPWQGLFSPVDPKTGQPLPLPEGCEIKSGLVVWNIESEVGEERAPVIPIPPGSTVQ